MKYQKTEISKIIRIGTEYAYLQFTGDSLVEGEPGQFVMIRGSWGNDPILPRAFSLVESGTSGGILVRDVGIGTSLLCNMKEGDPLFVLGPLGSPYEMPETDETAVLVAGGVGVAPLFFLAKHLRKHNIKTVFIYGARTSEDLPLSDEIGKITELRVTTEDGTTGKKGLVTDELKTLLETDSKFSVYSCGPHKMLQAVGDLSTKNSARCQVALESPMACGMGTCKGCAIKDVDGNFKYVCTDGPVFEAARVFGGQK
ncbi:MAG: dihydroorotate dehydrogenase electron transfer subunit [Deltaproteobacteria bacterium]|nr:dihydroorotate dehydrogenase electron transfer subunit [Deltaproteobacteria bacterium]